MANIYACLRLCPCIYHLQTLLGWCFMTIFCVHHLSLNFGHATLGGQVCVNNSFTLHIYLSISHLTDLTWRLLSSGSFTLSSVIMNHKFYLVIEGVSHFYNCALSTTSPIILQMWTRYFFEGFYHLQLWPMFGVVICLHIPMKCVLYFSPNMGYMLQ